MNSMNVYNYTNGSSAIQEATNYAFWADGDFYRSEKEGKNVSLVSVSYFGQNSFIEELFDLRIDSEPYVSISPLFGASHKDHSFEAIKPVNYYSYQKDGYYFIEIPNLNIYITEETDELANICLNEWIAVLWEEYVMADESILTQDALKLKNELEDSFRMIK